MKEAKIFAGEAWVGERFGNVTFIKAKDCEFKKENYLSMLQGDDPGRTVDSDINEVHMRHNVGYSNVWESNGFWEAAPEGTKGASLFYYAITRFIDGKEATGGCTIRKCLELSEDGCEKCVKEAT